jgi:hypothetical protein
MLNRMIAKIVKFFTNNFNALAERGQKKEKIQRAIAYAGCFSLGIIALLTFIVIAPLKLIASAQSIYKLNNGVNAQ